MAGGLAVTIGSTSLVVSMPGCGDADDETGSGGDPIGGYDAGFDGGLGTGDAGYLASCRDGYFAYCERVTTDTHHYYYYAFYCVNDPGSPWICRDPPDHDYFCYMPTYYCGVSEI